MSICTSSVSSWTAITSALSWQRGAADGKHGLSESFNRIVKRAKIDPQKIQGKGKQKFNSTDLPLSTSQL